MKKKIIWITASAFLLATGACDMTEDTNVAEDELVTDEQTVEKEETLTEQEQDGFAKWDTDQDEYISEEEFDTGMAETDLWDEWDANTDALVMEDEWSTALYNRGDLDDDQLWDEEEYTALTTTYEDVDWGEYEAWDTDGDGFVEIAEWEAGYNDIGWYEDWDLDDDAQLTEDEFYDYTYVNYDVDEDGRLERVEFETYMEDWDLN